MIHLRSIFRYRTSSRSPKRPRSILQCRFLLVVVALALSDLGCAATVVDSKIALPMHRQPLPPAGEQMEEPTFSTRLTRVTQATERGGSASHVYSQLQAFSPDGRYILLVEDGRYTIRSLNTVDRLEAVDTSSWFTPRWQPALPHTIIDFDRPARQPVVVRYTDVGADVTATVYRFPPEFEDVWRDQSFDALSRDGRWIAGVARRRGTGVIFALDLSAPCLAGQINLSDLYAGVCLPTNSADDEPDWVGVSSLGSYLVVQWKRRGHGRCRGLELFDPQNGAFITQVSTEITHGDLGLLADGHTEVFVTLQYESPEDVTKSAIIYYRLSAGDAHEPVHVRTIDRFAAHVSCQGPPGVCLFSFGIVDGDGWKPFEGELVLQYLDGSVTRLAHHRSSSCGYWVQPRASLSLDGAEWDPRSRVFHARGAPERLKLESPRSP